MKWLRKNRQLSDEDLMAGIVAGDTSCLRELYNRYSSKLLFYFFRMLGGDEEKSQDFLQDVFLKIIDKPHQFDQGLKFSTWIFTIASNLCKNEYRRLKVREIVDNDSDMDKYQLTGQDQDDSIDHKTLEEAINIELYKMDPDRRQTFLLRYQENLSIDEISKILECSQGTVKSRLFYITRRLATSLNDFNPISKGEFSNV